MGVNDMMNGSNFDADAARYDRMNRTNPAEFAPGQDAVFSNDDVFSQSTVPNNTGQMGDIFSTAPNTNMGMSGGGFNTGMPNGMNGLGSPNSLQPQMQQQPVDQSEKFWQAMGTAGKASMGFGKELFESIKDLTPRFYSEWGRKSTLVGVAVSAVGIISRLFGVGIGIDLAIGGVLSVGGGVCLWFFESENARRYPSEYKSECNGNISPPPQPEPEPQAVPAFEPAMDFDSGDSFGNFSLDDDSFGDDSFGDDGGGDDYSEYEDDWDIEDEPEDEAQEGMSVDEALQTMPDTPAGVYTRQYLWEMFTKVLPLMKPSFATMRDIDADEDVFLYWDEKLREAATVSGCKEDYLPELTRLQENLFTIVVTCDRPQGFKPDVVATELANIYAFNDETGEKNNNIFAKADTSGNDCRITIFNGAAAMISLRDMMEASKDFMTDNKNYMPVCLGVDQLGKVLTVDFKKLESVIITGMPRSGKSWFVQAVLTQMCAFVPPSQLNIYICDPKEGISDFKSFCLPHVKKFVSGDDNIVNALREIVKVEAPRRKRIIGDAGFVNIWDFKDENPDVKLPVIYVVIDEVVTLAERMEKEVKKEFQGLLVELISQLPALGIRAFLIPHVIKNDIIAKTATDLVPCKISVCGDANHIETVTGAKFKDFPYKLVNKGDMAVKLSGIQGVVYIHGPALTDSNPGNNKIFTYLRKVWTKLEPDEINDSVATIAQDRESMNDLLAQAASDDDDNIDLFGESSDDSSEAVVFSNPNEQGLSGFVDDTDMF